MLQTTMRSLQISCAMISQEALQVNRSNAPLLKKLSGYIDNVSEYVKQQINSIDPLRHDIDFIGAERKLQSADYGQIRSIMVPVPPGLSVSWLEYLATLRDAQKLVLSMYDDTLRPFTIFVGACINDPERTQQLINEHNVQMKDLTPIKEQMRVALNSGTKGTATMGQCLKRNADWTLVKEQTKALIEAQKSVPNELIIDTVRDIDEKIAVLTSKMSDTNEKYRPTPKLIADLAELIYGLAEKVTFYAVYVSSYNAYTVAMNEAATVLNSKVKTPA